ncbi:NUDIX domain-containing protein [Staphylococcus sp. IVB6246]|uniref:NUDIX hydrolase n=1 Tax=unclassified Staphylococcus TaxID=91994 RepID=UPI0021D2508C|nr:MULTISPECIES: NUDIX domain-containing protein [unclassified Staphylococcus]UXR69435.1 NUDIX domain-containing protein [Staphylococcus sp. IVB6246]UXR71490.1 NUDIX domain-containing protein [Staphylococcus sp. IVB6240]UXR73768.1 NUDIX domain-containing protein [Staphylococcus sp. IVB6238]
MIRCVCLVERKGDYLRLVQVRNREKLYFPGGKIEQGESLETALVRELKEELQLILLEDQLEYIGTVVGPAYPQEGELTELNGFRTHVPIDWSRIHIDAEITNIDWVHIADHTRIAPAVRKWIDTFETV